MANFVKIILQKSFEAHEVEAPEKWFVIGHPQNVFESELKDALLQRDVILKEKKRRRQEEQNKVGTIPR